MVSPSFESLLKRPRFQQHWPASLDGSDWWGAAAAPSGLEQLLVCVASPPLPPVALPPATGPCQLQSYLCSYFSYSKEFNVKLFTL